MSFEPVIRSIKKKNTIILAPTIETESTGTQTEPEPEPEPIHETLNPISVGSSSSNNIYQSGSGSTVSELVQNNAELERKFEALLDYLEKWINVGNITMNDIREYVQNYNMK